MKSLWMGVNVTFACNKQCEHCYMLLRAKEANVVTITPEVISQLRYKLAEHIDKYESPRSSHMCTFGGEPLLVPEITKELILNVREVIPDIVVGLNTNGTMLDGKFLSWFRGKGEVQYGIGDFELKDILDVCKRVVAHRNFLMPTYVLTPHNLDRIMEVVPEIRKYTPYIVFRHMIAKHQEGYLQQYKKGLKDIFNWMLETGNLFYPQFLWEVALVMRNGSYHALCGTRYVTIDPDGSVGVCCARNEKIGSLFDEDFDFYATIKEYDPPKHHFSGIEKCERCEFKNVCGGGCPYLKVLNGLSWDSPSPLCEANKEIIPLLLEVKRRWA